MGSSVFFVIIFVVFVGIGIFNASREEIKKKKTDGTQSRTSVLTKTDRSTLEHKKCDINVGDSCLHIEGVTRSDYKACKNCGHSNTKDAKKCSVCGKKLPWL